MQADPIGLKAGQNMYGYVAGDPMNLADSMGTNINLPVEQPVRSEQGPPTELVGGFATGGLTRLGCLSCVVQTLPGNMWDGGPSSDAGRQAWSEFGGAEGAALYLANLAASKLAETKPFSRDTTDDGETMEVTGTVEIPTWQKWVDVGGHSYVNPNYEAPYDYGLGGVMVGAPVLGFVAGSGGLGGALVESETLGVYSSRFGNTFYRGSLGSWNRGSVRFGWSFDKQSEMLYMQLRIGNWHVPSPITSPPPGLP